MNEKVSFLELFSDEAATPSQEFLRSLETRFRATARASHHRLSTKNKGLFGGGMLLVIIASIAALVLLPARDMSDPAQNSLIENAVQTSQEGTTSFAEQTETTPPTSTDPQRTTNDQQTQSTSPQNNPETTTPPPTTTPPAQTNRVTGFIAEFWNSTDDDGTGIVPIPNTPPNYTTSISDIVFNWGSGSPQASTINSDGFVARFTKTSTELSGNYKLTYTSDNGLRVFVDEQVVLDKWNEPSTSGTAYFTTDATITSPTIIIEYVEKTGAASVNIEITKQ